MVKNLKFLRNRSNLSQQQLARVLGTSQQSINKYENHGVEPDICMLEAMADYFNTSVDFLIGYSEIDRKYETVRKYDLNKDETELIDSYRMLTPREKESIRMIIANYTA